MREEEKNLSPKVFSLLNITQLHTLGITIPKCKSKLKIDVPVHCPRTRTQFC